MNSEHGWTIYRTRFLVRARQLTDPLTFVDALNREQSGRAGDYLVETSEGIRRIIGKMLFEDIYVPLGAAQYAAATGGGQSVVSDDGRTAMVAGSVGRDGSGEGLNRAGTSGAGLRRGAGEERNSGMASAIA
ncbi:MAG: hypothetical protein ACLPHI_00555 [Terriglobales bacterium]|jgi:hypothetical protein